MNEAMDSIAYSLNKFTTGSLYGNLCIVTAHCNYSLLTNVLSHSGLADA